MTNSQIMDNQIAKLVGLHRADFERVSTYEKWKLLANLGISLTAAASAVITIPVLSYLISIITLILAGLRVRWGIKARSHREIAERCRRVLVLTNGLGLQLSPRELVDIISECKSCDADAKKWEDPNYYSRVDIPGFMALAQTTQESAFWSKNLLKASFNQSLLLTILAFTGAVILLLTIPLINKPNWILSILQIISALLMFLVSSDFLEMTCSYLNASRTVADVDERLERIIQSQAREADVILAFTDYNSAIESAPKIPTGIYRKNKDRLNRLWQERIKNI